MLHMGPFRPQTISNNLASCLGLIAALAVIPRACGGDAESTATHRSAYHGLAIQLHDSADAVSRYSRLLREIAALGADTVLISVNCFQEHVDSVLIEVDPAVTPSDAELAELIGIAHGLGLRVVLMPKVLLSDPKGSEWRGKIKPPTWDGWFGQYRRVLLRYARLSQRSGVDVFIVGSELISTEKLTEQWIRTINAVREVYHGVLGYSANWDHYRSVQFWDHLDLIGMTSYYKLSDEPGPSVDELQEAWRGIKKKVVAFSEEKQKPILFTEAGWCSQEGCSVEAWNYFRSEQSSAKALEEQRRNYQVFIDTWADDPHVAGIIWWEWTEDVGGPDDYGYTPKGKPAEQRLRQLFERVRERAGARWGR